MIAVRVENLVKRFGTTVALDHVNLVIEPGELFFLLGPSGCGKTTLLRCLAGFCLPEEGRVLFGDDDVTRLEPHLRHTGMVFQNYALWPHLDVSDNVAFALRQQRRPRDEIARRVREALASVHMEEYAERKIHQLSGGQQQRVALARALVARPRCLLLDEPLSNLDAKLRHDMRQEIRRVCKDSGLTAIYVTHDQKESLSIGDRLAVLSAGRVRQLGTPREVYRRPRDKFVADFIGETNLLEGEIVRAGAGEAFVRTAVGDFQGVLADPAATPAPGTRVTLSIRPECLRLVSEPADENTLTGTIGSFAYYGEVAHYEFEAAAAAGRTLAAPVRLRISEINPRHLATTQGKLQYACADPDDVVVLAE